MGRFGWSCLLGVWQGDFFVFLVVFVFFVSQDLFVSLFFVLRLKVC